MKLWTAIALVTVVLALAGFVVVTILAGTFYEWLAQLDKELNASLFVTIAGLSLAAATFLSSKISEAKLYIEAASSKVEEVDKRGERHFRDAGSKEWFGNFQDAKKEVMENLELPPASRREYLESLPQDSWKRSYMRALMHWESLKEDLKTPTAARKNLVWSFWFFLAGLVTSLTVDLWAVASIELSGTLRETRTLRDLVIVAQSSLSSLIDSVLSLTALAAGVWFMVCGSKNLFDRRRFD